MGGFSNVVIMGGVCRDVESRAVGNTMKAGFGIAFSRKTKDGEKVSYADIECWSKTAELAAQYLKKGRQIVVSGRLEMQSWDCKQTGAKRTKLMVVADNFTFVDSGKRESQSTQAPAPEYGKRPVAPVQNVQRDPGEDLDVPDDNVPFHHERSAFWSRYETRQP